MLGMYKLFCGKRKRTEADDDIPVKLKETMKKGNFEIESYGKVCMSELHVNFYSALYEKGMLNENIESIDINPILDSLEKPLSLKKYFDISMETYFKHFFQYRDIENKKTLYHFEQIKAELYQELSIEKKDRDINDLVETQITKWRTDPAARAELFTKYAEWKANFIKMTQEKNASTPTEEPRVEQPSKDSAPDEDNTKNDYEESMTPRALRLG